MGIAYYVPEDMDALIETDTYLREKYDWYHGYRSYKVNADCEFNGHNSKALILNNYAIEMFDSVIIEGDSIEYDYDDDGTIPVYIGGDSNKDMRIGQNVDVYFSTSDVTLNVVIVGRIKTPVCLSNYENNEISEIFSQTEALSLCLIII
jgi:hypothetical protein